MPSSLECTLVLPLFNLQDMASRRICLNPVIIGIFQITENFIPFHANHNQLILIGINGKQVIINQFPSFNFLVEGEGCGE